jgi:hypothetical protein
MENVAHAAATVKMQLRLSVHHAQSLLHAAHMLLQSKSHMESGAVFLKMIAQQFLKSAEFR